MFKKRTLSLLLSLAMLLTFMPAMAFAEDAADENTDQPAAVETVEDAVAEEATVDEPAVEEAAEPKEALEAVAEGSEEESQLTSLVWKGATLSYYPYQDGDGFGVAGFYELGNKAVVTYKDGSTRTLEYKEYQATNEDGYTYEDREWFVAGTNDRADIWAWYDTENKGSVNICYDDGNENYISTTISGIAAHPYPVSFEFSESTVVRSQSKDDDGDYYYYVNEPGMSFTVTYTDGSATSKKTFKTVGVKAKDEDGDEYTDYRYFLDGDTSKEEVGLGTDYKQSDVNNVTLEFNDEDTGYLITTSVKAVAPLLPESATFVPASGAATGLVGLQWIGSDIFYGAGNKFTVKYNGGKSEDYIYTKYTEDGEEYEAFCLDGEKDNPQLGVEWIELASGLKKGVNTVTGKALLWKQGYDEEATFNYTATINCTDYDCYVPYVRIPYTGKTIPAKTLKKKIKVMGANDNGKYSKIPAKGYSITFKTGKKIGYYEVTVKFKGAYATKYGNEIHGEYAICPKTPTLSSVKAGKKNSGKITAKWKAAKGASGYEIEYSTDKKFRESEYVTVGKKKSYTISKLTVGKTYYVRVWAYKKLAGNYGDGSAGYVYSNVSKTKKIKVK